MSILLKSSLLGLLLACTSAYRADWDSGGDASRAHQDLRRQEQVENMKVQIPAPGRAGTDQAQPL
jgi:hypothetical protein